MTRPVNASPENRSASVASGFVSQPDAVSIDLSERVRRPANSPPLQRRLMANRENARKSTGPNTAIGKSASRNSALKHGLTAKIALPDETAREIASHFWQIVDAYRPVDAVAVNAILELSICSWKFRRLFEQYASHNAINRMTGNDRRLAREKRLAQKWFRCLPHEPRKSLAHLENTVTGLTMIVENLENLGAELDQPEGAWTSAQFLLAINLAGFEEHEIWDNIELRALWSAWFATRPGRKAVLMESQSFLPAGHEYRTRVRQSMDTALLPAEGRRSLLEWIGQLRETFATRLEIQGQIENELRELQPMAAGWPAPEETSQHLLYLRYSNQVDRKTRELNAIIAARPCRQSDNSWKVDDNMLPSDWKAILLEHRPNMSPRIAFEIAGSQLPADSQANDMQFGIIDEALQDLMIDSIRKRNASVNASRDGDAGQAHDFERQPNVASASFMAAIDAEPADVPYSRLLTVLEPQADLTHSDRDAESILPQVGDHASNEIRPDPSDDAKPSETSWQALSASHTRAIEAVCEEPLSIEPSPSMDPPVSTDTVVSKTREQDNRPAPGRAEKPTHRQRRHKFRQDKAADLRKGRHLHATSKPIAQHGQ